MVSQILVTLSSLVLVFSVMTTNAGDDKMGKKSMPGMLSIVALCFDCPNYQAAQAALKANKDCVKSQGGTKILDAINGKSGKDCWDGLKSLKNGSNDKSDKTLNGFKTCEDALKKTGGDDLNKCMSGMKNQMKGKNKA